MSTPSIPPKTRIQVAAEYQISPDTLRRRLRQMKIEIPNGTILPAHQRQMYERLGYPAGIDPADYAELPLPGSQQAKTRVAGPSAAAAAPLRSLEPRLRINAIRS